jgi:hypothetical protein
MGVAGQGKSRTVLRQEALGRRADAVRLRMTKGGLPARMRGVQGWRGAAGTATSGLLAGMPREANAEV